MEEVLVRLNILRDNKAITEEVYAQMGLFLKKLKEWELLKSSDTVNMMNVHIAMALQRNRDNKALDTVDVDVKQEVIEDKNYAQALGLWTECSSILGCLNESEKYYILANFCNILGE